jgi:hypothetical protein
MRQFDISAHPLLDQGPKHSGCEAEHKAERPYRVDTNDRDGRRMGEIGLGWDKSSMIRETGKLLRNLPEIKRIPVAGIWGQLFIAFNEKGSNGYRE